MKTVEEYISYLESKGFLFAEDSIGFIYFGKQYTNAPDWLVNTCIEMTLKIQKRFDGSFYVSLLESLTTQKVKNREQAIQFAENKGLFS
ncbi:DUF6123 family protein [Peribacillus tepidiphilus]|uniref:DUF6123 family protein n=1 Tax=Peribacillus tepidiphilus TaxID=2652445 RepID=UPI0012918683|nr:DUF6123 family protein [Peribacillus tepidiphilus]